MLQNKLGFKGATHQEEAERNWMECLNLCMTRIKSATLEPDCDDSTVMKLHIQSVDDVYCALQILAVSKDKDFLDMHLIKKNFWPLLNSWSHHLVLNSNAEDGKTVSDACMIGVLRGVTSCLTAMIACQKVKHPSQNVFNLAVIYFGTICKLLLSFTVQYKKTAPITVQCATIATVMALSFCDPDESYTRVHLWLASTQSDVPTKPKAKNDRSHPHLNQLAALYHDCSLRKMAHWMEGRAKNLDPSQHGKTLTQLLWG
uniref:Little elongation complex subunit 1 C-terminal domain-containing protein n=1 Tax=Ciona savignyi TaxID=51511 RepID=H2Z008_CIOSA